MIFYGEANNESFCEFIRTEIKNLMTNVVPKETIEQIKRRLYGSSMRVFNGVENVGFTFIRNSFNDLDIFDSLDLIDEIDVVDVKNACEYLDLSFESVTVITPETK